MSGEDLGHWAVGVLAALAASASGLVGRTVYRHDREILMLQNKADEAERRFVVAERRHDERHTDLKADLDEIKEMLRGR